MKKALIIILSYYFLQGVIHNLGHVVTPIHVVNEEIPRYMFGFFFSAMSLGLLIGAPIWGVLGDRRNKKPFIVLGLIGYSFGQVMFISTSNMYMMVFYRFISGFSVSATATLLVSQLIYLSGKDKRTRNLSISVALFTLGMTIGYKLGGMLGDYFMPNVSNVFYIQGITNTLYAFFVFLTFKDSKPVKIEQKQSFFSGLREATKMDFSLLIFLIALALATTASTILQRYLDVYVTIDLNRSPNQLGDLVLVTGLVGMFTNFILVPYITRYKKDFHFMIWIQLISAIVVIAVFRSSQIIIALYTGYMFYIILKSIYNPLEQNYISLNAQDEKYGSIMGVRQAFFAFGMVVGPLISGFIYDYNPLYVFYLSSAMFFGAFILLLISHRALKEKQFIIPETASHQLESIDIKASL